MNNYGKYVTPEELIAMGDKTSLKELKKAQKDNRKCMNCDEKVWKYGGAGLCFSCTTGESDASEDFELVEA